MSRLSIGQKLLWTGACLLALFLAATCLLPKESTQKAAALRLGAGDDVSGVLLSQIDRCVKENGFQGFELGTYQFVDCCAGTAQWALQARDIDLGFYCSQAALRMINSDSSFEIYGPVILNGEVLASLGDPGVMRTVGIPRKRSFLIDFAQEKYPQVQTWDELNGAYSLYALESGETDGVVIDVSEACRAGSEVRFSPVSDSSYISYCLVVRRDIEMSEAFTRFLACYQQAVDELKEPEQLAAAMGMDASFWEMSGTEFLSLS